RSTPFGTRRQRQMCIRDSRSPFPKADLVAGASIAVHGVCLTLVESGGDDGVFRVQAGRETLRRSVLRGLRVGSLVHLERALAAGDRLGGHIVQGHVDGIGRIARVQRGGGETVLDVAAAPEILRYLVEKGSVTVDGVSLTVGRVGARAFRVHVIPKTAETTLLARYRPGRRVNLEADILAKYVEALLRARDRSGA
ncbi:MAG: riboflavin synthase, partial [Candidatus Eisenbacteria bacterium]|nr:riboflavin synthase [Candidatus Eisenbacteria bacterium]